MSYTLVAEVLDHAPEMTAAERLVLVAIAEQARSKSRECAMETAALTRRTGGLDPSNIRKALRRLAVRGLEVRVAVGTDRRGQPVYAHRGHVPRYRLPSFPPRDGCRCLTCRNRDEPTVDNWSQEIWEGGHEDPPSEETPGQIGGRLDPPSTEGGHTGTEGGRWSTEGGRSGTDPVPQRPPSPSVDRDRHHQRPLLAYLSARTGATDEMTKRLIKTIENRFRPRAIGAYVRAMSDDDLADLLDELQPAPPVASLPPPCGECGPNRLRELPDGTPYRCPECHPYATRSA